MTTKSTPSTADLRNLTRDEWESLCHDLCAVIYDTERVEDRLGRGNGLDALLQLEPMGNVDGWQFKRWDDRLGDKQIKELKEAVTRAVSTCKRDLGGKLKSLDVFGNIDLQPGHLTAKGEDARFAEFREWCQSEYKVKARYRGVTWIRARLLEHADLRPNLFENLPEMMKSMEGRILEAMKGDTETRIAFEELRLKAEGQLVVLVTEAKNHFERGRTRGEQEEWRLAVESLRDAERIAEAPGVDITLLAKIQALLAGVLTMTGQLNEAIRTGRKAVEAAASQGDSSVLRLSKGNLAIALTDAQDYEEARTEFLDVLRLYQDADELSEVVRTLINLLHVDTSTKNWEGGSIWANRLIRKATELEQIVGPTEFSLSALGNIAAFNLTSALALSHNLQAERFRQAKVLLERIATTSRLSNMRRTAVIADLQIARALHFLREYDASNTKFELAIREADSEGIAKVAADGRYNQALMLSEADNLGRAATAAADAQARYSTLGDLASAEDARQLVSLIQNDIDSNSS